MMQRLIPALVLATSCATSSAPPAAPSPSAESSPTAVKPRRPRLGGRGGTVPGQPALDAAIAAAKSGDLDKVVQLTEAALEANPRLERAYLLQGSACALQGNDACEAAAYRRGLEILPSSISLQRERGFFLLRQGQIPEGVSQLEAARDAGAPEPQLLADLAMAYKMAGRLNDARATASAAVAADESCVACHLAQGEVALVEKDFTGAEAAFAAAVNRAPDNVEARRSQAKAAFLGGDVTRAAGLYADLAARAPDDVRVQVQAGQVLMKAGRAKDAAARFNAAAALIPNEPKLLEMLAEAQAASGDRAAAKATRARAATLSTQP